MGRKTATCQAGLCLCEAYITRVWSGLGDALPPSVRHTLRVAWFPDLPTVQVFDCLKYYAKFMALWRMFLSFSPLLKPWCVQNRLLNLPDIHVRILSHSWSDVSCVSLIPRMWPWECDPGNVNSSTCHIWLCFQRESWGVRLSGDLVLETILKTVHRKAISKVS